MEKPEGSPEPGAIECLIKIILSPSFAGSQFALTGLEIKSKKRKVKKMMWGTMFLIMVDEKKV
jgi:hypothetical protein